MVEIMKIVVKTRAEVGTSVEYCFYAIVMCVFVCVYTIPGFVGYESLKKYHST